MSNENTEVTTEATEATVEATTETSPAQADELGFGDEHLAAAAEYIKENIYPSDEDDSEDTTDSEETDNSEGTSDEETTEEETEEESTEESTEEDTEEQQEEKADDSSDKQESIAAVRAKQLKKEKELLSREQQLNSRLQQLAPIEQAIQALQKEDYETWMKTFGVSWEKLTNYLASGKAPKKPNQLEAVNARLQRLEAEKKTAEVNAQWARVENSLNTFISENVDKYPLITQTKYQALVAQELKNYASTYGQLLPFETVCQAVEQNLDAQRKRFGIGDAESASDQGSQQQGNKKAALEPKKRTITNQISKPPKREIKPLESEEERVQAAIELAKTLDWNYDG